MALMTRRVARENPHLYDLMFGLSTRRATYRPLSDSDVRSSGRSPAFRAAYVYLAEACARLVSSGRVGRQEPEAVTAQLWSYVHGCITLELAEHFAEFDDPVAQVLLPMGVNLVVGLGDDRERAQASHEAGRASTTRSHGGAKVRRALSETLLTAGPSQVTQAVCVMHPSSFGCDSRRRPPDRDPEERQRRLELVSGGHLNAPPLPSVDPDRLTCGVRVLTVFPSPPRGHDQRKLEAREQWKNPLPARGSLPGVCSLRSPSSLGGAESESS